MKPSLALASLLAMAAMSCGRSNDEPANSPGPAEDERRQAPQVVQDRGAEIAGRLGTQVRCGEWSWDAEVASWTCVASGLPRSAELELLSDGRFSELRLVLGFEEIQEAAPSVAETILSTCENPVRTVAWLALGAEGLVGADPRLAELWGRDGVSIEVECPDGTALEVDVYGTVVAEPDGDEAPAPGAGPD